MKLARFAKDALDGLTVARMKKLAAIGMGVSDHARSLTIRTVTAALKQERAASLRPSDIDTFWRGEMGYP